MTAMSDKRVDYSLIKSDYQDPSGLMRKKLRLIDSYITRGRNLLDFGAGTGELIALERQKFDNIYGVDSDERSISICEDRFEKDKNIQICQNDGSDLIGALGETRFDCIAACDVSEHIQLNESIRLLQVFYSLLHIGGKFIFTGPSIFEKVRIIAGQSPQLYSHHLMGGHD